jgi:hypothetical protein
VLVLEANSPEVAQDPIPPDENAELLKRHGEMREIAKKHGLKVIDLHHYLSDPAVADSGFIWWDFVHLTSYGQKLYAARLLKEAALP